MIILILIQSGIGSWASVPYRSCQFLIYSTLSKQSFGVLTKILVYLLEPFFLCQPWIRLLFIQPYNSSESFAELLVSQPLLSNCKCLEGWVTPNVWLNSQHSCSTESEGLTAFEDFQWLQNYFSIISCYLPTYFRMEKWSKKS